MNYTSDYATEITQDLRDEVLVHGATAVAHALEVREEAVRELAPEEAARWDRAHEESDP